MTNKRFERVYGDVEVVCIDHQKTGDDKFIDDEDYDKFVDLLNELNDEKEYWKQKYKQEVEKNSIITVGFDKNGNAYPIPKE